jgi:hypothetical protein
MTKRTLLSAFSAFLVLAGGAFLTTPAQASEPLMACSATQVTYVIGAINAECNCGGSATVSCSGYDIDIHTIQCYAC